jgi:hypothetical protein
MSEKEYIVYTCGTMWDVEVGHTNITVYPSIRALKCDRGCWEECGIVALRVKFETWVEPSKILENNTSDSD